jgi:hypothetical protein
MSYIKIERL